MKNKKVIIISVVLNILLLCGLIYFTVENQSLKSSLNKTKLPSHSYIADHEGKNWEADDPTGYYLFTTDDEGIKITNFGQEELFTAGYTAIGNGVYKLENDLGYLLESKGKLKVKLNQSDPLIYETYEIFDK